MSWDCPHQVQKPDELHCARLKKPCVPLQKGCVLDQWNRTRKRTQKKGSRASRLHAG